MKRIYIVMLFAALATITYAQTDDKGYQEGVPTETYTRAPHRRTGKFLIGLGPESHCS